MTQFEKLLHQTNSLKEALLLQPCLADGKAGWYIEEIRYAFIEKKFGIGPMKAAYLKLLIERSKKESFSKALEKNPPAQMLSMAICSHG